MLVTCKLPIDKAREINISFLRKKILNCSVFYFVGKNLATRLTWYQITHPVFKIQAHLFKTVTETHFGVLKTLFPTVRDRSISKK